MKRRKGAEEKAMIPTKTAVPIIRAEGEGEKRWFLGGGTHTWKVTTEESGGAFYLFEDRMVRGKMTPLHRHPDADEMLYVLEGEIQVRIGDREERVGAGGLMMVPRAVPHAFVVTSEVARLLAFQTPGAGEAFYRGASEPAVADAEGPVDFARVKAMATATGATVMMGPPPFAPA
jgi:quercetin dioxygenase-like cupin family protein